MGQGFLTLLVFHRITCTHSSNVILSLMCRRLQGEKVNNIIHPLFHIHEASRPIRISYIQVIKLSMYGHATTCAYDCVTHMISWSMSYIHLGLRIYNSNDNHFITPLLEHCSREKWRGRVHWFLSFAQLTHIQLLIPNHNPYIFFKMRTICFNYCPDKWCYTYILNHKSLVCSFLQSTLLLVRHHSFQTPQRQYRWI